MRKLALVVAAAAALSVTAPASAATVVLVPVADGSLSGTFTETRPTSGNFTSTFTFTTPTAGTASASLEKTSLSGINFTSAFLNGTPFTFTSLSFGTRSAQFGSSGPITVGAGLQTITVSGTGSGSFSGSVGFISGIPEPATWAMMISGFGMIGGAMRYNRRRTVKVSYAAA